MNPWTEVNRNRKLMAKAAAEWEFRKMVDSALGELALGCRPRVRRNVAQKLLLGSPFYWNGKRLEIAGKSVGAGIYEMSLV
jgi:hypothetical protein